MLWIITQGTGAHPPTIEDMSPPRYDADREFPQRAFLVREALQRSHKRGVFEHSRWHRPFSGVRVRSKPGDNLHDRALQYLPRLRPGERYSHATALALLGFPIRVSRQAAVDVSTPNEIGRVRCRGVNGHRHPPDSSEYPCSLPDYDEWVPVTRPLLAVQQAAGALPFPELVVALDFLLHRDRRRYDPHLQSSPDEIARFAEAATGRGAARFRRAAALVRVGAESRMETLMRLGAVRVGLPELRLQAELHDSRGEWIGRFDAVDEETRSIFEYDGEQHFSSRKQRRRDPRKHQAARDAGWRILVFYHEDIAEGSLSIGRKMLDFSRRAQKRVPATLAGLLDEVAGAPTESALPFKTPATGHFSQ